MSYEEAIKKQVDLLRKYYKIEEYPDSIRCLCNECDIENYLFSLRNNLYYEQILLPALGIDTPYHRASIIGFNNDTSIKWFLVDPAYGELFHNQKFANYMFLNYNNFSSELLKNGYVECTIENIYSYINGFVFSGAYTDSVDKELVYKNLYDILLNMQNMSACVESTYEESKKRKHKGLFKKKRNH